MKEEEESGEESLGEQEERLVERRMRGERERGSEGYIAPTENRRENMKSEEEGRFRKSGQITHSLFSLLSTLFFFSLIRIAAFFLFFIIFFFI